MSLILCSTASVKSERRDWTRFGSTRRLCAVCSDEARSDRFYFMEFTLTIGIEMLNKTWMPTGCKVSQIYVENNSIEIE